MKKLLKKIQIILSQLQKGYISWILFPEVKTDYSYGDWSCQIGYRDNNQICVIADYYEENDFTEVIYARIPKVILFLEKLKFVKI